MYVDGKRIGEGLVRSSNSSSLYDEYDLSEMMCAGNHVLALHVNQMLVIRHVPLALIAELELDDQTIISDNPWKYLHDNSYRLDTSSVCWIRTASGDVEIRDTVGKMRRRYRSTFRSHLKKISGLIRYR